MKKLDELMKCIKNSNNIVFFGGAGVSVASGIPDFRGAKGIYNETPEEVVSHDYFFTNTEKFYEFYFQKMVFKEALPNDCHKALAYLEQIGKLKTVVTQNIDGLHQKAGSKNVLELHGTIHKNHCLKCHKFYRLDDLKLNEVPYCTCGGLIKPDVVLYQESLDDKVILESIKKIKEAEVLIVAGTSLVVYPAASFIRYFEGKNLFYINLGLIQECNNSSINYLKGKINVTMIDGRVEDYLNIDNFKKYHI